MADDETGSRTLLLNGRDLDAPSQRLVRGLSEAECLALGTPAVMSETGNHLAVRLSRSAASDGFSLRLDSSGPTEASGIPPERSTRTPLPRSPQALDTVAHRPNMSCDTATTLEIQIASGIAWWRGQPGHSTIAVVTDSDDVHLLAHPELQKVHCEPLREGDRLVALSGSISEAFDSVVEVLEMALSGDPSPSAACIWILDAADESGAESEMFAGVWRVSASP